MSEPPLVPPLKCQGIKTKLVGEISALAGNQSFRRWVEPFCGSCVVALNVQPKNALLSDSNVHIIVRHPMIEALITNFPVRVTRPEVEETEQLAFFEKPVAVA
jgi:DNA adenine methylase